MFTFLKNWFAKEHEPSTEVALAEHPSVSATATALITPQPPSFAPDVAVSSPAQPHREIKPAVAHDVVHVLLRSALAQLPADLQIRVSPTADVEAMISVPVETVLLQLGSGAVKITFGELRRISPVGTFTRQSDHDTVLIPLPLGEILPQIDPELLRRRPAKKKEVAVPEEITGPFGSNGQGISISNDTRPQPSRTPPPRPINLPNSRATDPTQAGTNPVSPTSDTEFNIFSVSPDTSTAEPIKLPSQFRGFTPQTKPVPQETPASPVQPASSGANSNAAGDGRVMLISIAELAETWPDAVRSEIVQLNLSTAKIALPEALIEQGLKLGKIAFTWRELRGWVQPARNYWSISVNDSVVIELPLKIIAPLFLAKQKTSRTGKSALNERIEEIPSLFFSSAPPVSAPAAAAAPTAAAPENTPAKAEDTNYYVWQDDKDQPDAASLALNSKADGRKIPGTAFLRRYATPNEIISKAAALDGVAGAIIALPDGLLVASQIPPDMNPDTIAAFLPLIFGRVSQCTKELRMGEVNNLNFTVGSIAWKIFRVGAIYFAAFGRVGEPLPTGQLAGLAAELDRKPK